MMLVLEHKRFFRLKKTVSHARVRRGVGKIYHEGFLGYNLGVVCSISIFFCPFLPQYFSLACGPGCKILQHAVCCNVCTLKNGITHHNNTHNKGKRGP